MGPLSVEHAHTLNRQALAADVAFMHAPFFEDPAVSERPSCLAYGHGRHLVTSRPRVASLLDAVSWNTVWTGSSLGTANATAEPAAEYHYLGDYTVSAFGRHRE
ncbi:hypothetical protein OG705_29940 [Streptomyces sp. NBC_00838]|uniref:hypothetical protein n=1 Tax=Streptomyces sp. NBC_00838 TaxID=2903680 RepID=UPI0038676BE2|nr:hypothetical protein OG705_29940 [Streptomyces sp. NBC_00838]